MTCSDTAKNARPVVVVGEKHVNELTALLQHDLWIDAGREGSNILGTFGALEDYRTHSKKETERIISEMINASQRWPQENVVFLMAISAPQGRLIDDVVWNSIGEKDTVLDVGSVLDLFANVYPRPYPTEDKAKLCRSEYSCFALGCGEGTQRAGVATA